MNLRDHPEKDTALTIIEATLPNGNLNLILGAALDVFVNEPINLDNPLLKNNKVILSPHSATFTDECTSRMAIETTKNIIDFFENKIDKSMIIKL